MTKPTKSDLEYYIAAKPRVEESPGYFLDGKFYRGPVYRAMLGNRGVAIANECYDKQSGWYISRSGAMDGAMKFQAKMRELLDAGDYAE